MTSTSKRWAGIRAFGVAPSCLLPEGNPDHGYALEQRKERPPGG